MKRRLRYRIEDPLKALLSVVGFGTALFVGYLFMQPAIEALRPPAKPPVTETCLVNEVSLAQKLVNQTVMVRSTFTNGVSGSGTGVVLKNSRGDSYVLTARHVIVNPLSGEPASQVSLLALDGKRDAAVYYCDVVSVCEKADVAMLLVRGHELNRGASTFEYGAPVGTPIYHVGNYLGKDGYLSFTKGVVAFVDRKSDSLEVYWPGETLDQINLTGLPGSSGGGVWDGQGKLIGILVGKAAPEWIVMVPSRAILPWIRSLNLKLNLF